ncbi:MAG TPA: glycosyltransferase [Desulfomonilaceae bacterium]|nr:glycosyltransferase [Desulfomonilaceae bacterium]
MRILHLLHRSVPGTHGYAIRSEEIVTKQLESGLEPLVITSPSQAPAGELDSERSEFIRGVRYFRTCSRILPPTREVHDESPIKSSLRVFQNVMLLTEALRVAQTYRPAVIHGHSPFTCGIIANIVGRRKKIPSVYEMRGLWEDSHTSRHGISERSLRYRGVHLLEDIALRGADVCCVICDALKDELLFRGIPDEKIVVVPNGVDVTAFIPGPPNIELQRSIGLQDKTVIGYIGSFFHYEGLHLLVQSMVPLAGEFPELRLLLVGDGEVAPILRKMADNAGLSDKVLFTGRVPHAEIMDYYRLCDLMVLPRMDTRETRLVTPLKPLEIMAMGKPLIASDIGGHREIVTENVNGLLFKSEDVEDLVSTCRYLIENKEFRLDLGARGRQWVQENRDWRVLIRSYIRIYNELIAASHDGLRSNK